MVFTRLLTVSFVHLWRLKGFVRIVVILIFCYSGEGEE